jgi:hypothetical protein
MFDTAPLPLSEVLASEVAGSAVHGDWADRLAETIDEERLDPADLFREDYELMSDVPSLELLAFATKPTDLARVMAQLREGRDEVSRAAFRILRSAVDGAVEPDAAPYVAAACLNVQAHEQAHRRILAPGQRQTWLRWAALVPDPARARLLQFAEATADAA